eukprot:TRINITY_DN4064_c0_g1_i2.p1 TRINITY_DN4064_c0_g1~~TRINITY_DN4064_c0_g1_i2.p1  ORF type:complete len:424 (+),score=85.60 TRINITY_DN4064_c0_g1_i2:60-1331(+)
MSQHWVLGMGLNFVGSVIINLGTNLMKYSHTLYDTIELDSVPQCHRPSWISGMAIFFVGNIVNFFSFGYAAQSLLACTGSIQFVSNVAFAYFLLKEEVTRRVIEGTAVIVLGNTFTLLFASHESRNYSVDELYNMYMKRPFVIYIVLVFLLAASLARFYHKLSLLQEHDWNQHRVLKQIGCYSATSAMIGSLGVLLAKSLSQLLRTTILGDNQFVYFFTYFVFIGWLLLSAFWMERLNSGLRLFPSMIVVPALQVFWTVFSILSGGIYFDEFSKFSWAQTFGFTSGVLIIISGVYHLAPFNTDVVKQDDDHSFALYDVAPTEDTSLEPILDSSLGTTPFQSVGHYEDRSKEHHTRSSVFADQESESAHLLPHDGGSSWRLRKSPSVDTVISLPLVHSHHSLRPIQGQSPTREGDDDMELPNRI